MELETAASIEVMVVDDEAAFRRVARSGVTAATAGFRPVADAPSGSGALPNAHREHPDIVLMDDAWRGSVNGFRNPVR